MNLSPRYIAAFTLLIAAMLGWNGFLIVRDAKLFEAQSQRHKQVCEQLKSFHPDCQK